MEVRLDGRSMAETLRKKIPTSVEKNERRRVVVAALERLSDDDIRKLRRYAAFKSLARQGAVAYWDAEDLLQDAIARTLAGSRNWNEEKVEFVVHLIGTMRSIASQFREDAEREFLHRQEEQYKSIGSVSADSQPIGGGGRSHRSQHTLELIRLRLEADKVALPIFDRLREGYTPAEIQELLGINQSIYNAARKRIYRCIKAHT